MWIKILLCFISFAFGMGVSAAVVVFLSILGIVPQLASITGTRRYVNLYGLLLGAGTVFFSLADLLNWKLPLGVMGPYLYWVVMVIYGVFTGVLLSALAETFDVFPAFTSKLKLSKSVKWLIFVFAAGKVIGSLIFWLTPYFQ